MSDRQIIVRLKAEISDFRKNFAEATKASEKLGQTVKETGEQSQKPLEETAKKAGELRAELIKSGAAAQSQAKSMGLSYDATGQLRDEFGKMVTQAKAAALGLDAASDATREFAADQEYAADKARQSNTALGQLVQNATKNDENWARTGSSMLAFGAAVSVGVGLAIKSYAEFDKAMSEVRAATHASAGDMALLREAAIVAGADTSYSAREAAQAITELSKAGVTTREILAGGLNGALALAAAGSLEVGQAAEIAATAMSQFGLKGKDIPHIADLLAAGAGKAQGEVTDLALALEYVGPVAAGMGVSIEETTGALAAFATQGIIGDKAGTGLRGMLGSLTSPSKAAAKEIERLGINLYDVDGKATGTKGKFLGLANMAGQLQSAYAGMNDAQRDASLGMIFGNEQVTAARVLYKTGADGVREWTTAVNDSGFAAVTAAIKQDNLAGDVEKLGGSLDSVFLKSGSGANQVLRGLTQGAEDLIDMVGGLPAPLLQTGLGLTATAGGAALVGGTFLTMFPRAIESAKAFNELRSSNEKLHGSLSKSAKIAGALTGSLVALQIAGAVSKTWQDGTKSAEDYAQAFLTLGKSTNDVDALVKSTGGLGTQINGVGDALVRVNDFNWYDNLNNWAGDMVGGASNTQKFRDNVRSLDNTLVSLVQNGGAEKAGSSFKVLADEADKSSKAQGKAGMSIADVLKLMPQYTDSLKKQATALGLKLEQHELEELALGKIPARMKAVQGSTEGAAKAAEYQAKLTEEAAKQLEDMGLAADGTVLSLSKLLDVMFRTGLASMSARDAEAAYQETLDGLKAKIDEVKASQSAGNAIMDAATGSFDLTTEAGRKANGVFGELESKARATTEAMAANGASQDELGVKLSNTYQSLYDTARAFGASEEKADDLARSALGIPKGVPIETAIQNYADSMAKLQAVGDKADGLNGKTATVRIDTYETTLQRILKLPSEADGSYGKGLGVLAPAGGATGGRVRTIMGFNTGGKVPGRAPADLRRDNVLGMVRGQPIGLQGEEWIINGRQSKSNDRWLKAVNDGLNLDDVFQAPSKSMAGGYGQSQSFNGSTGPSGSAAGTSGTRIDIGGIKIYGATDVHAVQRAVVDEITYKLGEQGVRLGK
ncbi:hypothetical protein ASF72_10620 [Arthrobacter sp. Leaf141]|uniref:phage tail tape measure protein n=1 Tax=Arthrobacter sp. Leaf141 TaxID=1736273 RepID=UPI0006FA1DFE|nr:phage tail tape measure protein [Arthrobacter sp. Leaf141]KQR02479.1 hypothetical protein ASF72_10620 [Arthrobacter sp. Leaf141]